MGILDLDMSLTTDMPTQPTAASSDAEKDIYAKWVRSNKMCLLAMQRSISDHLLSGLPDISNARDLMMSIGERYQVSTNAEVGNLMKQMQAISYKDAKDVRDYILRLVHIQSTLRAHHITIPDEFIVHHALFLFWTSLVLVVLFMME